MAASALARALQTFRLPVGIAVRTQFGATLPLIPVFHQTVFLLSTSFKRAKVGGLATLSWADSAHDNKGYLIQQSADGMNFTQVGTAPANVTSFPVTGLQPGTTYSFRMCAFNSVGNSPFTGTATATTPATPGTGGLDFSQGFGGSSSLLTFNGLPPSVQGTALQLTDGGMLEASSAFSTTALNVTRFETQFTFQILNTTTPSADGFTFCIQTAGATALGPSITASAKATTLPASSPTAGRPLPSTPSTSRTPASTCTAATSSTWP